MREKLFSALMANINKLGSRDSLSTAGLILLERTDEKGYTIFHYESVANIYSTLRNCIHRENSKIHKALFENGLFSDDNPHGWTISALECDAEFSTFKLNERKFRAILSEKVPYENLTILNSRGEATPYEVGVVNGLAHASMLLQEIFDESLEVYARREACTRKINNAFNTLKWLRNFAKTVKNEDKK